VIRIKSYDDHTPQTNISNEVYQISYIRYRTRYRISYIRYRISDIVRYQISYIRYLISDIVYQISCIRYRVSDIVHQISYIRYRTSKQRVPQTNRLAALAGTRRPAIERGASPPATPPPRTALHRHPAASYISLSPLNTALVTGRHAILARIQVSTALNTGRQATQSFTGQCVVNTAQCTGAHLPVAALFVAPAANRHPAYSL
jgi:hypothetical protein